MGKIASSNKAESYASGSTAIGRITQTRQVLAEEPDECPTTTFWGNLWTKGCDDLTDPVTVPTKLYGRESPEQHSGTPGATT